MRRAIVVLGLAALACAGGQVARPGVAMAEAFRRPNLTVGFTLAWNTDRFPNGNRVAVLMTNSLMASRNQPQPAPAPPPPPAAPLTPAVFRTTPLQLGEAVYVLGFPYAGALDNWVNFTNGLVSSVAGMDNDTTEFQMTAAVQPGNSGGPMLDGAGHLLGVTVARMNDVAALVATNSVPQTVNFGIKGDVAASFLRVNGVEPKTSGEAAVLTTPQIAAGGKAFTAQVMCARVDGAE